MQRGHPLWRVSTGPVSGIKVLIRNGIQVDRQGISKLGFYYKAAWDIQVNAFWVNFRKAINGFAEHDKDVKRSIHVVFLLMKLILNSNEAAYTGFSDGGEALRRKGVVIWNLYHQNESM